MTASSTGHLDVLECLLKADVAIDLDAQTESGTLYLTSSFTGG